MRKAEMIVSIQQLGSDARRLLQVLHSRFELSQSQLAMAALQIELRTVRRERQPGGSGGDCLAILASCRLCVRKLNRQADILRICRQALASVTNGFVIGQRIELAAQAGGELKRARRCRLRRKICCHAQSRHEQKRHEAACKTRLRSKPIHCFAHVCQLLKIEKPSSAIRKTTRSSNEELQSLPLRKPSNNQPPHRWG